MRGERGSTALDEGSFSRHPAHYLTESRSASALLVKPAGAPGALTAAQLRDALDRGRI
jgi:hypothetical protein